MSYLVLARKYRPQTFEEVVGQEHVTRTLQNAIRRGRIHHAFLFCGGRGTGKTTTARILAKALSCEQAPTPTPCNKCQACVEITQGTSVDVQEIDAASQNRVEDIRDLREAIRYAPVRGKKKLYILDEVHMLSTSAFNALLKTLEEPPPHAVFVFATTDPHKLPQTILSRVQRYDFKLVPTPRLVEHLADVLTREGITFDRGALQLVAREGAGSVRDSLSLLDQVLASAQGALTEELTASVLGVADRGLITGLGRALVERDAARALQTIDSAYQRGFDLVQLARTLLSHLRDLVVVSVVPDPLPLLEVTASELDELKAQAEQARGRVELLFDRMVRIAEDTARATLARHVFEVGLVELCAIAPLQPIGELVDRLEELEDRLAGKAPRGGGRGGASAPGTGEPGPRGTPGTGTGRSAAGVQSAAATEPSRSRPVEPSAAASPPAAGPRPTVAAASPAAAVAAPAVRSAAPIVEHVVPAVTPPAEARPAPAAPEPAPEAAKPEPAATSPAPSAAAAPPAEAPPSAIPPAAADDFAHAVAAIVARAQPLSFLAHARALKWLPDRIELGFDTRYEVEFAEQRLPALRDAFAAQLGRTVAIDVKLDAPGASEKAARRSLVEVEEQAREAEKMRRRREALEHPSRALVRDVFGEVQFLEPSIELEVNAHG
ncbi:MAG: DNA polymerase III subunit gamma/tau [Polyangia bacterium]